MSLLVIILLASCVPDHQLQRNLSYLHPVGSMRCREQSGGSYLLDNLVLHDGRGELWQFFVSVGDPEQQAGLPCLTVPHHHHLSPLRSLSHQICNLDLDMLWSGYAQL